MKKLIRWCVMVGDEIFPDSLSEKREWANTYLGDAKRAADKRAKVCLAKVVIHLEVK
jgi:hypothetical protein